MNPRRVASFVDAVLSDRRPAPFKADPVDAGVLRVAIAMRAAQPGEAAPEATALPLIVIVATELFVNASTFIEVVALDTDEV